MGCWCSTDRWLRHSSLSAVISIAPAVPNLCVSRKVFLKHQVNWIKVSGTIQDLPWLNIWPADNTVEVLYEHVSLLVGYYVPIKVIHGHNKDKPWIYDQCRHAIGLKQVAHLWWTCDCSRVNWDKRGEWEWIKPTQRPSVSLVTETGKFL